MEVTVGRVGEELGLLGQLLFPPKNGRGEGRRQLPPLGIPYVMASEYTHSSTILHCNSSL
jgi:hypothetical protein